LSWCWFWVLFQILLFQIFFFFFNFVIFYYFFFIWRRIFLNTAWLSLFVTQGEYKHDIFISFVLLAGKINVQKMELKSCWDKVWWWARGINRNYGSVNEADWEEGEMGRQELGISKIFLRGDWKNGKKSVT